ncbi:hypothetical protein [Gorillibacterium sp. sgz500922]|uniref:hypothetical protein n=1 Tax=Gorillibacterium sp. sgz500922 TaxID=3446694 RepID=UPI003F67FAF6
MRLIQPITDDAMVAEFLRAEIGSKRFGPLIRKSLADQDARILTHPDLHAEDENTYRKWLLGEVRGYGRNRDLFENFPSQINWYKALLRKEEVRSVMYIDYSYWNELSNHTRLPIEAARNIRNNVEVFGVKNDGFREVASVIREGKTFPNLILVTCDENSRIVVLEGHARLTGFWMAPEWIPEELEVMIGFSPDFISWDLY